MVSHGNSTSVDQATGSVNNLGTPCRLVPLPPFAMLKRLENVLFSVRKASSLYNIERGKGYRPQRCQMSQELLSETAASRQEVNLSLIFLKSY